MRFFLSQFKTWIAQIFLSKQPVAKNQSELIERLSHELRTSLTGIVGYSEFVESNSTEPMVNFTAKIIRESSQGLARASNAYFDLHRLDQRQLTLECTTFSFSEQVRSMVSFHQRQALENNVNLFFDCSDDAFLFDIYADIQRLRQVVDALLYGAVQSVEKNQSIRVDVSLDEGKRFAKLSIIFLDGSTHHQVELLKEFWGSDVYKFRLQEGPGVELALVKALIHFLQGTVEYQTASDESPRLIVKFPICYDLAKATV